MGTLMPLSTVEKEKLEDAEALSPPMIYETVRREGEEELRRPMTALFFSGLAAGILISASILAEAVIYTHTTKASWQPLVASFGYSLGFLMVILGRMQLFTENTITTVLPLMAAPSLSCLRGVGRLWGTVLFANVVGASIAAAAFHTAIVPENLTPALHAISEHAVTMGAVESFSRGIPAGLIIAALVWMLAHGRAPAFAIVTVFVWFIAAADFTHVVAGSVEAAYLVIGGSMNFTAALLEFFLPTLLGNILGGTMVFSLLAWAQVKSDVGDVESAHERTADAGTPGG